MAGRDGGNRRLRYGVAQIVKFKRLTTLAGEDKKEKKRGWTFPTRTSARMKSKGINKCRCFRTEGRAVPAYRSCKRKLTVVQFVQGQISACFA